MHSHLSTWTIETICFVTKWLGPFGFDRSGGCLPNSNFYKWNDYISSFSLIFSIINDVIASKYSLIGVEGSSYSHKWHWIGAMSKPIIHLLKLSTSALIIATSCIIWTLHIMTRPRFKWLTSVLTQMDIYFAFKQRIDTILKKILPNHNLNHPRYRGVGQFMKPHSSVSQSDLDSSQD